MKNIGFIGTGKVGTAFGARLSEKGYSVVAAYDIKASASKGFGEMVRGCRICNSAQEVADQADLVFVTTSDDAISEVAAQVRWHPEQSVVHCSGANSTAALEPARKLGARVGCIHPCNTFASTRQSLDNLPRSTFTLEAEGATLGELKEIVAALEGTWMQLEEKDKPLYHASVCIACNYLYTIIHLATDLWKHFGISQEDAVKACMPILRGTIGTIENVGFPDCLTGPIARGDLGTIRKHLSSISEHEPGLLDLYKALGMETIPVALAKGTLDEEGAEKLRALLKAD